MTRRVRHVAVLVAVVATAACTDYVGDDLRAGDYPRQDIIVFEAVTGAAHDVEAPPPEPVAPRSLEVGTCFEDLDDRPLRAFPLDEPVGLVPCEVPHRFELYARPPLAEPSDPWPGAAAVEEDADLACVEAFEEFVGSEWSDSALDYLVLAPTEDDWHDGATQASCALFDLGLRPLEGTAERSGM